MSRKLDALTPRRHLLLWDGECSLCARAVSWVNSRGSLDRIEALPYQCCPSPPMTAELRRQAEKSIQLLTASGDRLSGARAVVFVLGELGWRPSVVRALGWEPLARLADAGYWLVARFRPLFGRLLFRGLPEADRRCGEDLDGPRQLG
jgi:predicted DCC family thiol-disulfide oxidoreductase YuxK